MKDVIGVLVASCMITVVRAGECDLHHGTVDVPEGFEFRRQPGIDSFVADIIRTNDGFKIHCDVGKMAGCRVQPVPQGYTYHRIHKIGETYACTGITGTPEGKRIATTISDIYLLRLLDQALGTAEGREREALSRRIEAVAKRFTSGADAPANFMAELTTEADLIDFMLIVSTYRSREDAASNKAVQDSDAGASHPDR